MERNGLGGRQAGAEYRPVVAVSAKANDAVVARSRHGKVYTTEQVRDFYAENGNRYNCYCSQIPVLLNDDGSIFNKGWLRSWRKSVNSGSSQPHDDHLINTIAVNLILVAGISSE
jgi:hypothetical protein